MYVFICVYFISICMYLSKSLAICTAQLPGIVKTANG